MTDKLAGIAWITVVIAMVVMVVVATVIPIVVVVVFTGPIALVHMPAVGIVIPVRVDVEGAFKRRTHPISGVPPIVTLEWLPIPF